MSKKLTLEDRYYISMYSRSLPCTLSLRFSIDGFLDQIEITPEEVKKYDIKITPTTFECNDNDYEVEYESFPPQVLDSMRKYVSMYKHEKNKDNKMIQKVFKYFEKII